MTNWPTYYPHGDIMQDIGAENLVVKNNNDEEFKIPYQKIAFITPRSKELKNSFLIHAFGEERPFVIDCNDCPSDYHLDLIVALHDKVFSADEEETGQTEEEEPDVPRVRTVR